MVTSRKNSLFRWIWWKRLEALLVRLIIRCRKVLPGTTTLQANCRVPIRDWSLTNRAERRLAKESRSCLVLDNLSSGKRASMRLLSSTIPMNSRTWEGPRVFDATVGTRRNINTFRRLLKLPKQANFMGSAIKKSSKMWITCIKPLLCFRIHSKASEIWLNRKGALRSPNGRKRPI